MSDYSGRLEAQSVELASLRRNLADAQRIIDEDAANCAKQIARIAELEGRVSRLKASGALLDEIDAAKARIAELEDERDVFARTLDKRDRRIAELEAFVAADDELQSYNEASICELRNVNDLQHARDVARKALKESGE